MANINNSWKQLFTDTILRRGKALANQGNITDIEFKEDHQHFEAYVYSSDGYYEYLITGKYTDDGQVSEINCDCPWARQGHNCKHVAAVLFELNKMGKDYYINNSDDDPLDMDTVSIKDLLEDEDSFSDMNDTYGNPLDIVRNEKFTWDEIEDAKLLHLNKSAHYFEKLGDGDYRFVIEYRMGFLTYEARIVFDRNTIKNIEIHSQFRNFNKRSVTFIALLDFVDLFIHDNPFEDTNEAARRLLENYNNICNDKDTYNDNNLPIIFRAYVETNYQDPSLTFKIGHGNHLYKVKNLTNLVEVAYKREQIRLGKFFDRKIDIDQMDEKSRKWFDFVDELLDINTIIQAAADGYTYRVFDSIPITYTIADKIDQLLSEGADLYDGKNLVQYEVSNKKIPMKIETNAINKSVKIYIEYIFKPDETKNLINGTKNLYLLSNHKWIKFANIDIHKLEKQGIRVGEVLEFGPETTPTFGRKILPVLKESQIFEIEGEKQLEKQLPPVAKFIFKLDFQDQTIICQPLVKYGDHEYRLLERDPQGQSFSREFDKEEKVQNLIDGLGFIENKDSKNNYELSIGASDKVDHFFDKGISSLKKRGKVEATAAFNRLIANVKSKFQVSLGIRLGEDTIHLEVTGDELSSEDIQAILNAYQEKKRYFMLKDGQIHQVDSPSIEELSNVMKAMGISLKKFVKGKMAVPAYRAFYLEKLLQSRNYLQYTSNDAFNKLIEDLDKGQLKTAPVPKSLKGILRPYQLKGFEWLTTLVNYQLGGLLADEMGLGKTLQVISVLLSRKEKRNLPSLIVVPASVVYNWEAEIKKFSPELETMVLGGGKAERSEQLKHANEADVLITSYDSLKRDLEKYEDLKFDLEVIDEAQNIKNARAAVAKAVKVINASHRIALTGTPIENNLSELWSIFDYLMPGFLGEYDYFKNIYEKPIVKDGNEKAEQELSQIIAPFILRRLKKDVLNDLPDKNEQIVYAKLSGKQDELYQAQSQKLIQDLNSQDEKDFKKQRFQVLAAITKLRELCCDPHLLYEDYRGKSAKLQTTMGLLEDSLVDGHKILLFSQFTSMLDIFEEKLKKKKIPVYVITGSTPKQKRQELVQEFNKLTTPAVFLISLKAGGTGINLTSADVVVHYDPWWNVAAENQATDRAHRIGQKNDVTIYKMVAKNTIEEKIVELQEKKEKLAEAVLNGENIGSNTLNKEDLLKILGR